MRGAMASWMAVLAVACLLGVAAAEFVGAGYEEEQRQRVAAGEEFVAVHRHFGGPQRDFPKQEVGDGVRTQWKFNPWSPFQTFGVRKAGHVHRKCGMAAKFGSFWSNMFGLHEVHHRHHHGEEEHHHDHRFMGNMEHRHMHHRYHFGWNLLRNFARWFSGIPSFLSDVPGLIRNWSARVAGRKAPTVESVTEPLDMHALQKPSSPSLSCTLREKLSHIFAAVADEVVASADSDLQSDSIKRNLKKFMGDSMQLRIVKNICDISLLSPCEQEFCDVFLSHPKSGILMAFRILGLNPVRAAINPKIVAAGMPSSKPLVRPVLSPSERDMALNLRKTHRLAHIVFQRILAANPTEENVPDIKHTLFKNMFSKISGGEPNPCKACLRQEIFRLKKLAKKSMIEVCENPVDSHLEQSCQFAKENRFVFKTLFAYKFKFWEKASSVCRDRNACHSPMTPHEPTVNTLVKGDGSHNLRIAHFDVNHFRNPRGAGVAPFIANHHGNGLNCRQRALHRAAMLRGHSLDVLASELLKGHGEQGAIIVVEFVAGPEMVVSQEMHSIPLSFVVSSFRSVEFEPLREILKKPLVDSSPIHVNDVMEDAIAKPHDVPDVTSTSADAALELPSGGEHPDM